MDKIVHNLRGLWRDMDIIFIREVCQGCSNPNCKAFKAEWGENAEARFSFWRSNSRQDLIDISWRNH